MRTRRTLLVGAAALTVTTLTAAPVSFASGQILMAARPTAKIVVSPHNVSVGQRITVSARGSTAPAGLRRLVVRFGDGTHRTSTVLTTRVKHRYAKAGTYTVKLTVTDRLNRSASASRHVRVGAGTTPQSGRWVSTSLGGPHSGGATITAISFTVSSNHSTVTGFTFSFDYSGILAPPFTGHCSGSASTYAVNGAPTPISGGQFSGPVGATGPWYQPTGVAAGGSGAWKGSFDSPTTAHGTATFYWSISGSGCYSTSGTDGPFTWTAKR